MFHRFKYYLLDKQGKSHYLKKKLVEKSAIPKALPQSPDGWQDITVGYQRDFTGYKLGVTRSFTLPLAAVRVLSFILKHIAYAINLEQEVYILIQRLKTSVDLTGGTFSMIYKYLYRGQIDFSSFSDKDVRTSVSLSEGGIARSLKANEGTTYENSLDDPEAVLLKNDGVKLYDTAKFIETPVRVNTVGASGNHYVPLAYTVRTGNAFGFAGFQVFADTFAGAPAEPHYIFATEGDIDFNLKGTISLKYNGTAPSPWRYTMVFYSSIHGILAYMNPSGSSGEPPNFLNPKYVINFDLSFGGVKGERFYIYSHWTGNSGTPVTSFDYLDGSFEVFFGSRYQPTYEKCFKLSTLGKRVTKQVTGNEADLDTTFLEQNDNILLTSGDGHRGLPSAKIKTSLADYSEFVHTVLAAGQGIENNKLLYAQFEHFLKTDNPRRLGTVANFITTVAKDFRFNTVKIGWPAQEINDVSGKYSFNNSHTYQLPTSVDDPKQLSIITKWISCCYYQEIYRLNLEGKTTTDDNGDNQVFVFDTVRNIQNLIKNFTIDTDVDGNFIQVDLTEDQKNLLQLKFTLVGAGVNSGNFTVKNIVTTTLGFKLYVNENITPATIIAGTIVSEYYTLNRPNYSSISGVPDDNTVYNVELSPKRLFLKHKKWINSICYNLAGQKVRFLTTEKNGDLVTTRSGITVAEKSDYEVNDQILFKPFYHEFDVSYDLIEAMETDSNLPFMPTWYDDEHNGFLVKAGSSPNDYKAQQFKLLAAPDSDLTNLIF